MNNESYNVDVESVWADLGSVETEEVVDTAPNELTRKWTGRKRESQRAWKRRILELHNRIEALEVDEEEGLACEEFEEERNVSTSCTMVRPQEGRRMTVTIVGQEGRNKETVRPQEGSRSTRTTVGPQEGRRTNNNIVEQETKNINNIKQVTNTVGPQPRRA